MNTAYVVDASTVMKLFVEEEQSLKAFALFNQSTTEDIQLYVPDLLYIECANVFWKYTRRFGYRDEDAKRNLRLLAMLPLKWVSAYELFGEAYTLAIENNITAYDACYLLLAKRLGCSLITADQQLVGKDAAIVWLGDYPFRGSRGHFGLTKR